jgi:putative transposase
MFMTWKPKCIAVTDKLGNHKKQRYEENGMSQYKRHYQSGGHYFFTLVTYQRSPIFSNAEKVEQLKIAINKVKKTYPFSLNAMVVLPDHLHCLWKLPEKDNNFSMRWRLIKRYFSMEVDASVNHRKEKEVWQRRFWEHTIRDVNDWQKHMDYIHYNPVKHGLARMPLDWQHSSFNYWVGRGLYEENWGSMESLMFAGLEKAE